MSNIACVLSAPQTAESLTKTIMQKIRSLEHLPERSPLYPDEPWHSQGVRFFRVKKYLIFYTVHQETKTVSVARIMYGGRDISQQLKEI